MTRLLEAYKEKIAPQLAERFSFDNPHQIPRLQKIVLNMGVGKAVENKARIDAAVKDLTRIAGQKAVVTRSKVAVAGFKLRKDMPIGCMVTLRGARMYEFLDRLISVVLPRIRDFQGVKDKLDGHGNYSLGLSEQSLFPEIELDKVEYPQGMDVTIVTSARNDDEGRALLEGFGMPFRRSQNQN